MANERVALMRNTGTAESPVWEKWFAKTVADAVLMSDTEGKTKTIVDYVNQKIADLIGGAPETYDTLKEVADYIASHKDVSDALNEAIGNKVDKVDGKGLSTNDYDNTAKEKVENAYSSAFYTNDTPTVNALGGVAAGITFENMPISDVLNKLLYPWVAPVVTVKIDSPANGGVVELGTTQNVTSITVTVTKKSASITRVEIFDGITSLGAKTDGVANGGTFTFPVSIAVTANKGFQAKVTDADGKVTTANTGAFTFVSPYYYGAVTADVAEPTEALVKAATKAVQIKGNKIFNFTCSNQKMLFAYPKSYGALSKILDANSFDVTGTFTQHEVTVGGVAYYAYMNDASTVSAFKMTFNY